MNFPVDSKNLAYIDDYDVVIGDFLKKIPLRYHAESGVYYLYDAEVGRYYALEENQTKRKVKDYLSGVWNPKLEASFLSALPVYAKTITNLNNLGDMIICKNGVLSLSKKKLLPFSQKYHSTFGLDVDYCKDAKAPTYDKFVRDISCGDEALMATYDEILGYVISDSMKAEKLFCFVGGGRNGKSTFLSIITSFVGEDSVATIPIKDINNKAFSRHFLANKKLNIVYEGESSTTIGNLFSGTVKSIITEDPINAEIKMGKAYSFVAKTKLIMATNTLPKLDVIPDYAILRRYLVLPFNQTFSDEIVDKGMKDKLLAEQSGILNRALEGLERLKKNQYVFSYEVKSKAYLQSQINEAFPVLEFAETTVVADVNSRVSYRTLKEKYTLWCRHNGISSLVSDREFAAQIKKYIEMKRITYSTFKAGNDRGIVGIRMI